MIDPRLRHLVLGFVDEATALVDDAVRAISSLPAGKEAQPRWRIVARALHTIKGSGGAVGLADVAELAHRLEDVVEPLHRGEVEASRAKIDLVLQALDALLAIARAHAASTEPPELATLFAQIDAALALPATSDPAETAAVKAAPVDESERIRDEAVRVDPQLLVGFGRDLDRLRELRRRLDSRRATLRAAMDRPAAIRETEELLASLSAAARGDLLLLENALASIEDRVKALGTEPVRTIIDPLERPLKRQCRAAGKEASLAVVGGEISVDRRALRPLHDLLVQILRNAVDHGIEPPETRLALGKHREGAIVVRVEQHGNSLFLEITDDGAGVDLEAVRQKAVERALGDTDTISALSADRLHELLFLPGFSTRGEVSDTSGRGIGMDVVRSRVAALGGQVELQSNPGQGTRVFITVPIELATSPLLVVSCGGQEFGVPMSAIERAIPVRPGVVSPDGTYVQFGADALPLRHLSERLGLAKAREPAIGSPILILRTAKDRFAVAVDALVGEIDMIMRTLPPEIPLRAYSGVSTATDGAPLLVIQPAWLAIADRPISQPRRALVVDDSLTARTLHRAMLEAGGFTVHAVASADEALERLRTTPYEIVVCDVEMAPLDGLELTRRARTGQGPQPQILLVSAHDAADDRRRALEAGANGFIGKRACAAGGLIDEVRRVLGRAAAPS